MIIFTCFLVRHFFPVDICVCFVLRRQILSRTIIDKTDVSDFFIQQLHVAVVIAELILDISFDQPLDLLS